MKTSSLKPAVIGALALILSAVLIQSLRAYDLPWPPPTMPPVGNAAAFPAARMEWIGRFLTNIDRVKGKQIDLIFDGDSITDFWQGIGKQVWLQHYDKLNATDFGIAGDQIQNVLWRVQNGQLDGLKPKLVVLLIGTNNMPGTTFTTAQIAEGIKTLVGEYEKRCPDAHILLLGIFPRAELANDPMRAKIIETNQLISALDDGKQVTYLDFGAKLLNPDGTVSRDLLPDYLHPSAKGFQVWADAIQPIVDKYCPSAP